VDAHSAPNKECDLLRLLSGFAHSTEPLALLRSECSLRPLFGQWTSSGANGTAPAFGGTL